MEPDLDVSLGEVEHGRQLDPAGSRDVLVEVELLLELQQLTARVRCPRSLVVVQQIEANRA